MRIANNMKAGVLLGMLLVGAFASGCKSPEQTPDEPIVEAPRVVEEPVAQEPAVEEPVTREPASEEPAVEEPVVEEPVADESDDNSTMQVDAGVDSQILAALSKAKGGDLASAEAELRALADKPGGGFLASYNLGLVHEAQGAYDKAAQAYTKSLSLEPDFSPALINLSRLYVRQGRVSDAKKIAERYINNRPRNLDHRVALFEVMLAQKRYEDVALQARELLRKDEQNVDAMMALANANYRLGRYELSRAILERAAKLAPERGDIFYRYALVELKLDNKVGARSNFEQAISNQANFPEAHNNLGVLYHEARDYENAIASFEAAVRFWPDFKEAYLNLGNAHKGKGQFRDAEVAFRKAIEIDSDFGDAHFNLALLYLESDVPGMDALQRYQKAIDTLNTYKSVARGRLGKADPADKYIAEAKNAIEEEKARQELLRESQMGADDMGDNGMGGDEGVE